MNLMKMMRMIDEIDIEDVCPVVSTASAPITTIQQEDELEGKSDFYMNFLITFTIKVIISTDQIQK